ncbi:MAG TPA: glucuronate isomerase [Acidimicrobiales bacterium]
MAAFLDDGFLLSTPTADSLFSLVESLPIVDAHSHLDARELLEDRRFGTITELWLDGDHYKWRAMRAVGIDERLISGPADAFDRFEAWAGTLEQLALSPLQVWSHLELRRCFGIDVVLTRATAREVFDEANVQLKSRTVRELVAPFHVKVLATTDDPGDDLAAHAALREDADPRLPAVVPTWRPDPAHRLLGEPAAWKAWAERLGKSEAGSIDSLEALLDALRSSWRRFVALGARSSDHALAALPARPRDRATAARVIGDVLRGVAPDGAGQDAVAVEVLTLAAELAVEDGAVVQLHLGARRDASPRLAALLGSDAGADAVGGDPQGPGLFTRLAELEAAGHLPTTVLYNVNAADDALFSTVTGVFARDGGRPAVRWGPVWWFNDHERGIRDQLELLAAQGVLGTFVGMHTDSRSWLSFTRHELYRRVLCDVLGQGVARGVVPDDDALRRLAVALCGQNALDLYGFALP